MKPIQDWLKSNRDFNEGVQLYNDYAPIGGIRNRNVKLLGRGPATFNLLVGLLEEMAPGTYEKLEAITMAPTSNTKPYNNSISNPIEHDEITDALQQEITSWRNKRVIISNKLHEDMSQAEAKSLVREAKEAHVEMHRSIRKKEAYKATGVLPTEEKKKMHRHDYDIESIFDLEALAKLRKAHTTARSKKAKSHGYNSDPYKVEDRRITRIDEQINKVKTVNV